MRLIIGNILFWSLIYIQVLVFYEIHNGECSYRNGAYAIFFSIYISIDSGILPISLMLIFGLLTLKNIRQSKRRTGPLVVVGQVNQISRKDLQLSKMLGNQISVWIILNIVNPCYLLYRTITINAMKSPLRLTVELFINNMTYFLVYLGFALTFFLYTSSSPLFRRELKQLIRRKLLRHFG